MTIALSYERTACHGCRNGICRNTRNADTDRIGIACIEHVHQVGSNGSCIRNWQYGIFLNEIASHHLAVLAFHQDITAKLMFTYTSSHKTVSAILGIQPTTIHIDFRALRAVYRSHHHMRIKAFTGIECCSFWNNERIEFIHIQFYKIYLFLLLIRFLPCIIGKTFLDFLDNRLAFDAKFFIRRSIQRQHSHQDDIHQVNHLLARRNRSFLDCHGYNFCLILFISSFFTLHLLHEEPPHAY